MSEIGDKIEELLIDWESARQSGRVISVDELCKDHPELVDGVTAQIAVLQQLSWMDEPVDYKEPREPFGATDETAIPDSDVTVAEFLQTLTGSGLLTDEQLVRLESSTPSDRQQRAYALASELVRKELITPYQAKVIMERGDSPLLLDRYVILDSIGGGGMGVVFKALQRSLERVVAVKVLPKYAVDSAEKVERFQREMRAAAKLSHPNVVQAFDAHESNGVYFFAMEYVPGSDLAKLVEDSGPLSVDQSLDILRQTATGLADAHRHGIIHRDVKPSNILLSHEGVAKVLDLGLARVREIAQTGTTNLTRDGLAMGTVTYMSPEQAFDAKVADERSDIYSLGCTLYYLLHGKPIFDEPNSVQTVVAHRETPPPRLSKDRDDVPVELEQLFQRMVAKNPLDRPASMIEVKEQLAGLTHQHTKANVMPTRESPDALNAIPVESVSTEARSTPWLRYIAAVGATALIALALGLFASQRKQPTNEPRALATELVSDEVSLLVTTRTDEFQVDYVEELPDEPFTISGVLLYPTEEVNLDPYSELKDITTLYLVCQNEDVVPLGDLPGIEKFNQLEDVSFDGFGVNGNILSWLASLESLSFLDLSECNLPQNWAATIAKSPALGSLSLVQTHVNDEDMKTLSGMKTLHSLDVSNSKVSVAGIRSVASLPLQMLAMTGLDFQGDRDFLANFPDVEDLYLDGTNFDDSMASSIVNLTKLRLLHVGHTNLGPAGVRELTALKSLRELRVEGLPIQEVIEAIATLPKLRRLSVENTDLNDQGLETLGRLNLKWLNVADTQVSDAAVERFKLRSPSCLVIDEVLEDGFLIP